LYKKNILYLHGLGGRGDDYIGKELKKYLAFTKLYCPTLHPSSNIAINSVSSLLKKDWDLIITFSFGSLLLKENWSEEIATPVIFINPLFEQTSYVNFFKYIPNFTTTPTSLYKIKKIDRDFFRNCISKNVAFSNKYLIYSNQDEVSDYSHLKKSELNIFKEVFALNEKHNIKDLSVIKSLVKRIL